MTELILAISSFLAAIAFLNRKAFSKLLGVGKAQMSKLANSAENSDPLALYQQKIDDASESLKSARLALAKINGTMDSVQRQVSTYQQELKLADARIKMCLEKGDEALAAQYVSNLQSIKSSLSASEVHLETLRSEYNRCLEKVKAAQDRIAQEKKEAESLGHILAVSKAEVEVSQLTDSFNWDKDSPLDEAARHKEQVQKMIDLNRATGKTNAALNESFEKEAKIDQAIRDAEAKEMLDKYKKELTERQQ